MKFSKILLTLCFGLMVLFKVEAQAHNDLHEIHSKSVTIDNKTNLLRHGHNEFQYDVTDGNIELVIYEGAYMTKVVGDQKAILMNQWLGDRMEEYSDPSETNISVWKTDEMHVIFDLATKLNETRYELKFYFHKH